MRLKRLGTFLPSCSFQEPTPTRVLAAPTAQDTTLSSGAVAPEALVEPVPEDAEISDARTALDASFEEARQASEKADLGQLRIVSLGTPRVVDDRHASLPMIVEDDDGRRRRLTVTVGIDVEASGAD